MFDGNDGLRFLATASNDRGLLYDFPYGSTASVDTSRRTRVMVKLLENTPMSLRDSRLGSWLEELGAGRHVRRQRRPALSRDSEQRPRAALRLPLWQHGQRGYVAPDARDGQAPREHPDVAPRLAPRFLARRAGCRAACSTATTACAFSRQRATTAGCSTTSPMAARPAWIRRAGRA